MQNGDGWHESEEVTPCVTTPVKLQVQQHLSFIDFSENGKCLLGSCNLASRTHTGSIWLFPDLDLPIDSEKSSARHVCEAPVMCGVFVGEERVIVSDDTGAVVTYLFTETDQVNFVPHNCLTLHDSWISSLSVCPGANETVTGGADARICVLDNESWTMKSNYYPAHGQAVSSVAASLRDSSVFASSSMDRSALLWDTRLPKPATALMEGDCGYTALAWKDENHLAIGSESGMVYIHDIRSKQSILDIPLHQAAVRKLSFSKSGLLAACSDSVDVRLWNFETNKMIFPESKHDNFISDLAWNPKTGDLVSCGLDGNVLCHSLS